MPREIPTNQHSETGNQRRMYLRWHLALYSSALVLWASVALLSTSDWSAFWPMIIWTQAIIVHYLVVRSINVDTEWIEKRTDQVTDDAKDTSHIETIRDHYVRGIRPKTRVHPPTETKASKNLD